MDRRSFLASMAAAGTTELLGISDATAQTASSDRGKFVSQRPAEGARRFKSKAVEAKIAEVQRNIRNMELRWLFENCYPNTLDTTVQHSDQGGRPDTFIITGDIAAMWLRDSTEQTAVYIPLASTDPALKRMFRGLMRRQAACILLDPYANAFYSEPRLGDFKNDVTEMKPGVHERKWEIDSLCYPIRLASLYWRETHDAQPFDDDWRAAAHRIVDTFEVQQRLHDDGPYQWARETTAFYDNSPNHGRGNPTRKVGLIHSAFRPSDDSCFYPFLIPSNMFARTSLDQLAALAGEVLKDEALATQCRRVSAQLSDALEQHGRAPFAGHGEVIPFEVDGYGNRLWMDDANAPGLLSLPYLGCCARGDELYQRTRSFVLSTDNPYFTHGKVAEGIGGPHTGPGTVWPLSIIMRALTTDDPSEIRSCVAALLRTHAGTGFMHESFDPDDPTKFTRPWFAWCNSLFGELIVTLSDNRPELLRSL